MTLIHVIIGLGIGVVLGFTIGFLITSEDIEFVADNFTITTYDCAKNYDKWRTFLRETADPAKVYNESLELMENRCFITVKSWAHQSDYEKVIWSARIRSV